MSFVVLEHARRRSEARGAKIESTDKGVEIPDAVLGIASSAA